MNLVKQVDEETEVKEKDEVKDEGATPYSFTLNEI